MIKRVTICWLFLAIMFLPVLAQIQEPITFKTELNKVSENEAEIIFKASIEKGWHLYSTELGDGGPISATFNVDNISGAEVIGKLIPKGDEINGIYILTYNITVYEIQT